MQVVGSIAGGQDGADEGGPARPVRDPGCARCGRDGRGLPGAGHPPRPHRRHQGAARAPRSEPGAPATTRARGPGGVEPVPPQRLCAVRPRPRPGRRLPGHGVPRGRVARRPSRQGAAAHRRAAADRGPDRRRPREGAPLRHHPPRPQARQRHADPRRREAAGLRPRQGRQPPRRRPRRVADHQPAADHRRHHPRHLPVHGAGAARGRGGGRPHRHLRLRRRALRDGHRPARLSGQLSGEPDRRHHALEAAAGIDDPADDAAGARPGDRDLPGQGPGRALADRARRQAAARVDRGGRVAGRAAGAGDGPPQEPRTARLGGRRAGSGRGGGARRGLRDARTGRAAPVPLRDRGPCRHGPGRLAADLARRPPDRVSSDRRQRQDRDLAALARQSRGEAPGRDRQRPGGPAHLVAGQPLHRLLRRRQAQEGLGRGRARADHLRLSDRRRRDLEHRPARSSTTAAAATRSARSPKAADRRGM